MGGGIKKLNLIISGDKKVYYPGEIVRGICEVFTEENARDIPGVIISCKGKAKTHWAVSLGKGGRSYSESRDLLDLKTLYTPGDYDGLFGPGSHHKLPFQFRLPVRDLHTSLEYTRGYIRYWIEADSIVQSLIFDKKTVRSPFKTLQLIDTNLYQFPVQGHDEKTICCWCCASGNLSVEASTDRAAYCPSEIVTITATFRNDSSKMAKPYAKLKRKLRFEAEGTSNSSTNEQDLEPINSHDDGNHNVIWEGGFTNWNRMQFRFPVVTPSVDCGIIKVKYELKVGLEISLAINLEVCLPIVIATIPFRGGYNNSSAATSSNAALIQGQWVGHSSRSQLPESVMPPLLAPPNYYSLDNSPPPSYFATILEAQRAVLDEEDWNSNNVDHEQQNSPTAIRADRSYPASSTRNKHFNPRSDRSLTSLESRL